MGAPQNLAADLGKFVCEENFADGLSSSAQLPVSVREFLHIIHFPHLDLLSHALVTPCVLSC